MLGIAGVEGNGQTELVEAVVGALKATTGVVTLDGRDVTSWGTRDRREAGVGYIPEDRQRHGLLLDAPLWENRILGHQTRPPSVNGIWLNRSGAREDSERIVEQYDVRTPGIDTTARALSGGNQQKFIVGREMSGDPVLLIAAHPTRGVDVGAQAAIWDHIREARRRGLAVLLISADLDELIGLSDSMQVILRGKTRRQLRPAHGHPARSRSGDDRCRASASQRQPIRRPAEGRPREPREESRAGARCAGAGLRRGGHRDVSSSWRRPATRCRCSGTRSCRGRRAATSSTSSTTPRSSICPASRRRSASG